MKPEIEIVDRGRGPQLSTSRITVQDLVPYFLRNCSYRQIMEVMPVLTEAEIQVVERYFQDHRDAAMEEDRRIREETLEQIRLQQLRFPDEDPHERRARMRQLLDSRRQEKNGAANPR